MILDFDDFGANHIISDQCQSHDCRDKLDALHYVNNDFKVTLFTIPFEMTLELAEWCRANASWVELAVHGFRHSSNYECEKMTLPEFDKLMFQVETTWPGLFTKGFKAPGWQISDDCYLWLNEHNWWVADQAYNNKRRPGEMKAYVNYDGKFRAHPFGNSIVSETGASTAKDVEAWHGHTWNCVGNGIYETYDHVADLVKNAESFQFVSEVLR